MNCECLICGSPLKYNNNEIIMECAVCLSETSRNPIEILRKLMALPACHMHGPEHHVLVGSALLTAYKNAGGKIDLEKALLEMQERGKKVPGGACGYWGACGAGLSAGMFVSIVTGATPLSEDAWGLSNKMTSMALGAIGEVGGPRCCKRDSYIAVIKGVEFSRKYLGVEMESDAVKCIHSEQNNQCIKSRCPFFLDFKTAL